MVTVSKFPWIQASQIPVAGLNHFGSSAKRRLGLAFRSRNVCGIAAGLVQTQRDVRSCVTVDAVGRSNIPTIRGGGNDPD